MKDTLALRLDFAGQNKDWHDFAKAISDNTGNIYRELWIENARANRMLVRQWGWATELQDAHSGRTSVLLGASPAIKKQLDQLRELQKDSRFVFIGITSGLKYMLESGIVPKYCMIADADPKMARFWEGLDMDLTKDTTLIASLCVHPDLLKMWKGKIKFLAIDSDDKEVNRKIDKWYRPVNGVGRPFFALSSQYNTGAALAYTVFRTHILIFVGNELSFKDESTPYYVDRPDIKDSWDKAPHINIFGDKVYTNYNFMALKIALEDFLGKVPGFFFNATEAGIFGVSKRYGNLSWIIQLKLDMAIRQARHIMDKGEPMYDVIQRPTTQEIIGVQNVRL